jgi:hypothetical protein
MQYRILDVPSIPGLFPGGEELPVFQELDIYSIIDYIFYKESEWP